MASQWLLLHFFLFLIPAVAAASLDFPASYRDIQLDIVGLLAVVGMYFCVLSYQVLALTLWPQRRVRNGNARATCDNVVDCSYSSITPCTSSLSYNRTTMATPRR